MASASTGAVVVGAGLTVGVLAADLQADWVSQAHIDAAMAAPEPGTDLTVPRPVIVTRTEERHVTPDPVVVHEKVYTSSGSGSIGTAPRTSSGGSSSGGSSSGGSSRTVVRPAPAAPAPAKAPASSGSTSKRS